MEKAKALHPDALVLTHPECTQEVLEISDFIGSTSQIIDYATASEKKEFIICTEMGVFYELQLKNPDKQFYSAGQEQICADMKKITLEKIVSVLQNLDMEVELEEEMSMKAEKPLTRMLELAK